MDSEKSNDSAFPVAAASVNVKQSGEEGMSTNEVPAVRQPEERSKGDKSNDADLFVVKEIKKPQAKKLVKHPSTAAMVLDSIKTLKMRKGASILAISKYIEEKYGVDMRRIKPHMHKYFFTAVENGDLEQVGGDGDHRRFKIKKKEDLVPKREKRRQEKESTNDLPRKRKLKK